MRLEERADMAAQLKTTGKYNCTRAVLKVFEDKISLDAAMLTKMTAGFSAGMGCMESTCGALIGAVIAAGILTDGKGTAKYSKDIVAKFQQMSGATICKDLKGLDTGQILCDCPKCVQNAVIALGETIKFE